MNARTLRLAVGAWTALVLATFVSAQAQPAQEQDAYLQRYEIAVDNLRTAVSAMPGDGVLARESVDRAFNALLTMSRDSAGSQLVMALERIFERSRTAIGNGSQDDVAVQAAVLEGGFQRLVYDAALQAAVDGDLPLARERLDRLAQVLGFTEADRLALIDPSQPASALRFHVEAGTADAIALQLGVARELASSSTGGAYRALARAYGSYLLVQDSPRTQAQLNQAFVTAANALVEGDTEAFTNGLQTLTQGVEALGTAARERRVSVPGSAAEAEPTVVVEGGVPLTLPALDGEAEAGPEAAEATEAGASEEEAAAEEAVDLSTVDLAALYLQWQEAERRQQLDELEAELAGSGLPAASRPAHAERLLDGGYRSLAQLFDGLGAASARVVAATHAGDDAAARAAVGELRGGYERFLSPMVRAGDPSLDTASSVLFDQLLDTTPLRVQDANVLSGQVQTLIGSLAGRPEATLQAAARTVTGVWAGPLRDVVSLVVGLLALIPLFLLNVAFGGGNRHWQSIGVALFLLLLPALFEGVIGLGGVLAHYFGIDTLTPLAAYSVFSSTLAQTVWVVITLLAVTFAIVGLLGISRQFGLLGGRSRSKARGGSARGAGSGGSKATASSGTVDWDDDL